MRPKYLDFKETFLGGHIALAEGGQFVWYLQHAGIRYSYNNQGYPFDIFNQTITHQDMLSKYMEEMSTALVAYFPNMTMNQARSLSLFGLGSEVQSSPQFANYIALYGFNANGGTDDWSEYALKYKVADNFGTKCNNQ